MIKNCFPCFVFIFWIFVCVVLLLVINLFIVGLVHFCKVFFILE